MKAKKLQRKIRQEMRQQEAAITKQFLVATGFWSLRDRLKLCWQILNRKYAKEVETMTLYAVLKNGALQRVERDAERANRFRAEGYDVLTLTAQFDGVGYKAEHESGTLIISPGKKEWLPKQQTKKLDKAKSDE